MIWACVISVVMAFVRTATIAAGRGHKEAKKLLAQASTAKKNEVAYRRWVDTQRVYLREYWQSRYTYRWYWNNSGWYYRDDY